jgi:hypothetical protein
MTETDQEIELTEEDLDFAEYSDGHLTDEHVLPDLTPIYCRTCKHYRADCTCAAPEVK